MSGVASALFTPVQQRVLGLLFGQPERRFQSAELIRLAGSGTGAVHRQLQRLEKAGLVTVARDGNQKYYAARRDAPGRRFARTFIPKAAANCATALPIRPRPTIPMVNPSSSSSG